MVGAALDTLAYRHHPGRNEAESRDRSPLYFARDPGSARLRRSGRDDGMKG
jgi:hypothetical protein